MIQITKDTLRLLNSAVGKLDTDNGKVFAGFVGSLNMADGLYHGELRYTDPGQDLPKDAVSIKSVLEPLVAANPSEPNQERSVADGDAQPKV